MSRDPDALAGFTETTTDFEAQAIAALLRDAGIEAVVSGGRLAPLGMGLGLGPGRDGQRVVVEVRERDLDAARRVVERNHSDASLIDWDEVDVGDRRDALPLHRPGRLPWPAAIGFAIAAGILLFSLVAGIVMSLGPAAGP